MEELDLLDWKRRVFDAVREIRASTTRSAAWRRWRDTRDELFARTRRRRSLPRNATASRACLLRLRPGAARPRGRRAGRARAARDRNLAARSRTRSPASRALLFASPARDSPSTCTGSTATAAACSSASPMRRAASETYGACRYLLDTVKGSDLGERRRAARARLQLRLQPVVRVRPALGLPARAAWEQARRRDPRRRASSTLNGGGISGCVARNREFLRMLRARRRAAPGMNDERQDILRCAFDLVRARHRGAGHCAGSPIPTRCGGTLGVLSRRPAASTAEPSIAMDRGGRAPFTGWPVRHRALPSAVLAPRRPSEVDLRRSGRGRLFPRRTNREDVGSTNSPGGTTPRVHVLKRHEGTREHLPKVSPLPAAEFQHRADLRQSSRGRALPQVPPTDLRGGGRAGGGRANAHERDHARARCARPTSSPARAAPGRPRWRESSRRRSTARTARRHARRHLPRVRRDRGRHLARRDRDGRRFAARDRRHPRHPRPRRPAAGRGAVQGLHPRRGAPAHRRRVERAAQADRGAAAPPALRVLHDRAAEGAADRALALPDLRLPAPAARRPGDASCAGSPTARRSTCPTRRSR